MFSFLALCVLAGTQAAMAQSVVLTIDKTHDAPTPILSGQVFTYTIAYSWTGATAWSTSTPGTLIITDNVPATLDVISAAPGSPVSTIVGNNVTFNLNNITSPAGSGTVQINVRFKPGVTCPNTRACNTAIIRAVGYDAQAVSKESCATATASNKWQFRKDYISGCIVDSGAIVYRISLINPAGNDIGGLNLSNITLTDFLPPGAIITGVTGSSGWTVAIGTTGTFTFTPGPTALTVAPGWAWYEVYITVRYPGGLFTSGQTVTNRAQLSFQTPCSQGQKLTMDAAASNTLCNPTPPAPGGSLWKWLTTTVYFPSNPWYTPSWSPGCCGTYYVQYYNNGGLTQSNIVLDDNIPPTVDVNSVYTNLPVGMTSVIMDVYCNVGGICQAVPWVSIPYTTSTTYIPTGLPGPICRIRWRYTGNLAPGRYIYNSIGICVRSNSMVSPFAPVLPGQNITNTVCVTGTNVPAGLCANSASTVTATAPNILTAKFFAGKSGTCLPTCTPNTTGPFYPGDILRWRMVVANVGSATATPCTITDMLPTGFSYVGNPTYYYGPITWATANNPSCCALTTTVPSVIGGLASPAVGATNLIWNFATLPAQCNGAVNYLVIEFDVKANNSPTIPPGNYFNTFTFSAGNLTTPVTSNPAQVTINGYAQVQIFKDVRPNISGTTFAPTATVQAGNQAQFRIRIQNTGILSLANIYLLDILPHVGDISVLPPYFFRGSQYDLPLSAALPAVGGYTYGYNYSTNTKNPIRSTLFCATPDPGIGVPPITAAAFAAGYSVPTFSFRIVGNPATTIAPGGTQDFFFVATVPPGTAVGLNACNSFGLQVYPYGTTTCMKAESAPACVKVIPPDKPQCDSIWGHVTVDECCTFNTTILNTLGSIAQLSYNVIPLPGQSTPSGVVQSVSTTPCLPSSTIPGSLAGTTSGSLIFSPPCPNPLGVQVHATSTTASGEICIELIAVIVNAAGSKVVCRDTVCFQCDPAPKDRCDSMSVLGLSTLNYSTRSFTIHNLKSPSSPICDVHINVTPHPGSSNLYGSNLFIDGVAHSWPSGSSAGWSQITAAHGLPANTKVQFDLNIPYGIGWTGNVTVTVVHCDGQKCTMDYGPWTVSKKGKIDVGTPIDVPDRATLHMHSLTFSRDRARDLDERIRSIGIRYDDQVTEIVAVTGATYPCGNNDQDAAQCNDLFETVNILGNAIHMGMRRDLTDEHNQADPIVTVVYRAQNPKAVSVEIIYYDAYGQEVGHDELVFDGEDPPNGIIAGLDRGDKPTDDKGIMGVLGALTARPNPTSGRCDLGFTLPWAAKVDLELLDALGNKVTTVINGEQLGSGEHHRMVDMSTIPSGTYLVALRVNGVPSVLRVELAK